ncbi:hypothetical protein CMMCAS05_08545 [Clavibacter michiganensis subsp. michiganensis]|nr:hypothetical protein CMMCAS05_08545 [Clavibacter michiganensis subsp. michiganensis]
MLVTGTGGRLDRRLRVDVELAERLRLDLIRGVVDDLRVLVRHVVPERRQLDRVVVVRVRGRGGILDELGVDHRRVRGHDGQRRAILRVVDRLEDHLGGRVVAGRGIRFDLAGHHFACAVRRGSGHVPGVGLAGELHVARVDGCVRDAGLGRRCVEVGVVIVGVLVGIDLVERGDARVVLGRVERDDAREDVGVRGLRRVGGSGIHAGVVLLRGHGLTAGRATPADGRERLRGPLAVGVGGGTDRERIVVVVTVTGSAAGRPAH